LRVALLSAGPSLLRTFNDSLSFDHRIGVNRAAERFPCDWWSVGDWQAIVGEGMEALHPIGEPRIFTMDDSANTVSKLRPELTLHGWKHLCSDFNAPDGWSTWSSTAAVMLARYLNATTLDVYGVDMAGHADVSGRVGGRSDDRWNRERPAWEAVVGWIRAQGVRVTIHQPTGVPEVMAA
jgi:hypothetical protein